jgi:hypothetical protein
MNECKHKILVALVFTMAMHQVIAQVVIGQHWNMMSPMLFFMEFVDMALEVCNMWRYD